MQFYETASMLLLPLWLISSFIWAYICGRMATARGRAHDLGNIAGFLFGFWAMIYYLIAGDTVEMRIFKEEEARAKYREKVKVKNYKSD